MAYDITDFSRTEIYITDGWREWYVPKFRIDMVLDGDFCYLYWTDTEKGTDGLRRLLPLDYNDVTFGYLTPSSASEVETVIEAYIDSAWTDIPIPPTPDLTEVLTAGADGGGLEITNIADGTAADSAATVGQLDAIEYSYHIAAYGSNPPGATSFFISGSGFISITSLPDRIAIRPKYPILITKVQIMWQTIGTAGSNENISAYIRVNNTTDYLIATVGNTSTQKEFYNASMNGGAGIALNGTTDYYVVKFTTPTPVTAWTNVNHQGEVFYLKT